MVSHLGRRALILALLGSFLGCSSDAPETLELNRGHDSTTWPVVVGQEIDITLQTIGPGEYGTPEISSPAVRFLGVTLPEVQNPGGPTQLFRFEAVSEGSATITIAHTETNAVFTVTLTVS